MEIFNTKRPQYKNKIKLNIDNNMEAGNLGVFYNSPGWKNNDFYGFLLMQRIFANYLSEINLDRLN